MTRDEKNELLVKFACAAVTAARSHPELNQAIAAKWAFSVADAMLAEYIKRQPVPAPMPPPPTISDAEWERGNEVLEKFKKELNSLGTPPA